VKLVLIGVVIGLIVYLASSGHIIFLPLIILLPLGWRLGARKRYPLLRQQRSSRWRRRE
jgi:hypothetical protein